MVHLNPCKAFFASAGALGILLSVVYINQQGLELMIGLILSPWEFDGPWPGKEAPAYLLCNENDESKRRFDKPAKKRKVNEKSKPDLPNYFI